MPFVRRRPLLRAAAVGGVAYMGAKAGTNKASQAQGGPGRARPRRPPRRPRPGTGGRTRPATTPSPG